MITELEKYNFMKNFLKDMDNFYLVKRKKQLIGIITRAQQEKDAIDNEMNDRRHVTEGEKSK